jgi:hypothetical protein
MKPIKQGLFLEPSEKLLLEELWRYLQALFN